MRSIDFLEGGGTALQRANALLRERRWEQALIAYSNALTSEPWLRPLILGNVRYLLKRAPHGSIDGAVLSRVTRLVHEAEIPFTSAESDSRAETVASKSQSSPLKRAIEACLGVDHIYVINLERRPDRYLRVLREMTLHGLSVERINGVDAAYSEAAQRAWTAFRSRPIDDSRSSSAHVSDDVMRRYKCELTPGVFGYVLSQGVVVRDAIRKGYRRILVMDDDVFFHSDAVQRIQAIGRFLPHDLKILLLGASEYADRSSDEFKSSRSSQCEELYAPLPGRTCGSFAVVYDHSVYGDLLTAIEEADGTFDNVILGSLYLRYQKQCFAVDPAICIPDVADSDIRHGARVQVTHGARMNWDVSRYGQYTRPLDITVLVNDIGSLRHIESARHEVAGGVFMNVYYRSADGMRPVIPGHLFSPRDSKTLKLPQSKALREMIRDLRIPSSDIIVAWPEDRLLTEDTVLSVFTRAMEMRNLTGTREGSMDGVAYCLDAGVQPIKGRHSVIIPSYRDVDHVWPAVRSALLQDVEDFEVIVVNDNPSHKDFSSRLERLAEGLAKEYGINGLSERLAVIDHKLNRHAAAARNTGLMYSSGEFVSFLDDDDYFEPNRLSHIEAGFSSELERLGATYCGYTGTWNGERNMERFPEGDLGNYVFALRYSKHYMCTNTVTFRRRSLQRLGGFNEGYARHQDLELMARFFKYFTVSAVREFLVKNRPHPVPETFVADIPKLCRLKHQFLTDMKGEIKRRGGNLVAETIHAHTNDIVKRDKRMSPDTVTVISTFLLSALDSTETTIEEVRAGVENHFDERNKSAALCRFPT